MNRFQRYRPLFSIALRYLLGAAIVFWLFRTNLISFDALLAVNLRTAIAASLLVVTQLVLAGWRVQILLEEHGISAGIYRCISFNAVGIFYSLFLPGGMSGDLARAYCFWRSYPQSSRSAMFGALFVDRLLGTVAMIVMGLIGGSFLMDKLGLTQFVLVCWLIFFGLVCVYLLVTRMHRSADKSKNGMTSRILRFMEKIDLKGYSPRTIVVGSLLSLAGHLCAVLVIYMFSQLLASGLDILKITAVAPLGLLANALPLTPGGLGIGEKGFELLYQLVGGVNGGNSFLISRLFLFAPALLGAVVVLFQFVRAHRSIISGAN